MEAVYAIAFKISRGENTHQIIERLAIIDCDRIIRKGTDGVIISMSAIALPSESANAENNFKSINIIIENPENSKNAIVGNLEIPFPEEGETKIQIINDIIEIKLLKIKNLNSPVLLFSDTSSAPTSASVIGTYANKVEISRPVNRGVVINPKMNELLKRSILEHKKEFYSHNCYEKNKSNCIIEASKLNTLDFSICGQCRRFLSNIKEFKCKKCNNSVFIDIKGFAKNENCNNCSAKQVLEEN